MCAIDGIHTAVWSAIIQRPSTLELVPNMVARTHAREDALYEGDLLDLRPSIMLLMLL